PADQPPRRSGQVPLKKRLQSMQSTNDAYATPKFNSSEKLYVGKSRATIACKTHKQAIVAHCDYPATAKPSWSPSFLPIFRNGLTAGNSADPYNPLTLGPTRAPNVSAVIAH